MLIIGADPGLTGAVAFITTGPRANVLSTQIVDMPTLARAKRREVSASLLVSIIRETAANQIAHVFVEQVSAAPIRGQRQGTMSMFSFGRSVGVLLGVLAGLDLPVTLVPPQVWKQALHVASGKDASRARAIELYPGLAAELKRVKDHGRADALLIATYGVSQETSNVRISEGRRPIPT